MTSQQLRHAKIVTAALPVDVNVFASLYRAGNRVLIVTASGTPMWGRRG